MRIVVLLNRILSSTGSWDHAILSANSDTPSAEISPLHCRRDAFACNKPYQGVLHPPQSNRTAASLFGRLLPKEYKRRRRSSPLGKKLSAHYLSYKNLPHYHSMDIRSEYGRFRILIVGRANAGKTTILQKICKSTEAPRIFDSSGNEVRHINHPKLA